MTLDDMRYNLKKIEDSLYMCLPLIEEGQYPMVRKSLALCVSYAGSVSFTECLREIDCLIVEGNIDEAKQELMKIIGE